MSAPSSVRRSHSPWRAFAPTTAADGSVRLVAAVEATLTGANDRAGFKGERAKVDAHHWMQAVDGDQNDKADEEECLTLLQYMQQMLGGAYGDVSGRAAAAADDERALNGEEVDKDEM